LNTTRHTIKEKPDYRLLQTLLSTDSDHPHIHLVDMPYRLSSTWQENGCELGIWEKRDELLAWAVFQPPWWNLDFVIHPSQAGLSLEKEIFEWGKEQMMAYAKRSGEDFYGSVEIFEDAPGVEQTIENLLSLGFEKFDWSILRFEKNLQKETQQPQLPEGYSIRPLRGKAEVEAYVELHRAAFGSEKMTTAWRMRVLEHPYYRPEIDLVVESPKKKLVGFCVCWQWQGVGQIEPLGVHPEYQGKGLGKALELSAHLALRNSEVQRIFVDHASENTEAIALSLKTGFRPINNAARYFVEINPDRGDLES